MKWQRASWGVRRSLSRIDLRVYHLRDRCDYGRELRLTGTFGHHTERVGIARGGEFDEGRLVLGDGMTNPEHLSVQGNLDYGRRRRGPQPAEPTPSVRAARMSTVLVLLGRSMVYSMGVMASSV